MSDKHLGDALDGARMVRHHHNGLTAAWFAGHGVHLFDLEGNEVDYFSVGDFADSDADYDEVVLAADRYLDESFAVDDAWDAE
jgi:hypothetical protein